MMAFVFLCAITLITATEVSTYATCGGQNGKDVEEVIKATVARLMELRHPSWGWFNTPEVVVGIQLGAQKQFFGINKTIEHMKNDIASNIDSVDLGVLAMYVLAVKSVCLDPRNFAGRNLVEILDLRTRQQFSYDGERHILPYDRYYRYGLAMGALCVSNVKPKRWAVRRILKGQNKDGSFGQLHSVDDAAEILLAFKCIEPEFKPRRLIRTAIEKITNFLRSNITSKGNNMWIGDKYATPSSALGMMEASSENDWMCGDIMKSLAVGLDLLDTEAAFSQRLPALAGVSYLSLEKIGWKCQTPVPIPEDYKPICVLSDPPTCNPSPRPALETNITVRLTIYIGRPDTLGGEPSTDFEIQVRNGTTLIKIMEEAQEKGLITYQTEMTSWGELIVSVVQGVVAAEREYWHVYYEPTGNQVMKGAGSLVPKDRDHIAFRLKTW